MKFIEIDEEGYFKLEGLRASDPELGRQWLTQLTVDEKGRTWTTADGQPHSEQIIVEAFNAPFVALDVEKQPGGLWSITMPYGHRENFALSTLRVDEWDRFHGRTERGIPFVFARATQARFFDEVDEFEDEAFTVNGTRFETQGLFTENSEAGGVDFWSGLYRKGDTGWELNAPSPPLPLLVPRLKLQRARVLVLGAGTGNDAAWFASQGHLVTAIDFSTEAITAAKAKYGNVNDLNFVQADVFNLPSQFQNSFDIVFENTLFCAIQPARRNELIQVWRRVLIENGHLLGIFATMERPAGPPYGASEWELRERLRKEFRSLYWTRIRDPQTGSDGSTPSRLGKELFFYGQKLNKF